MQSDEVIWQVIGKHFCAFKIKAPDTGQHFCRNEYNLTGLCNRLYCPLANSQYATVREHKGICYLYMKTVERSHLPAQLWEKVRLPNNYKQGLQVLDTHLQYFPEAYQQKCKKRLKRLFQYLTKVRKLKLHDKSGELSVYKQKTERREARREKKAEQVARLDQSIEKELVARLKSGLYQDIYNVSQSHFENILKKDLHANSENEDDVSFDEFVELDEDDEQEEEEEELEEDEFEIEEEEEEGEGEEQFVESEEDIEDSRASLPQKRSKRGESFVRIEYEQEEEPDSRLKQRL